MGGKGLLSPKNIRTARPARKLDWKRLRPYTIKKVIYAYTNKLAIPSTVHLHPVFHVYLLDPAPNDPVPGQLIPPPLMVMVDVVPEYEIEEILDYKIVRNRL